MRTIGICLLLGASIAACQTAPAGPSDPPAPPEVDAALRSRVAAFYQAQMSGKFRQADQYVAEDTKDHFYAMPKVPILKFEIAKIAYLDNFKKAAVTIRTDRELAQAMIPKMRLTNREISDWKIENGLWCWTFDENVMKTPFGDMRRTPAGPDAGPQGTVSSVPSIADMTKTVSVDKSEVELGSRKTDQVVFRNSLPGPVILAIEDPQVPGLDVKLEQADVAPNGTTRVLFSYNPEARGAKEDTVTVNVAVQPTGQAIPIQVKMKPPGAAAK